MKRFFASITALLMLLSLAACSSTQTSTAAASQQASTSETGKSENELIAEENDILAANNALWEKVFASMDKNVTDTTLSSNYGDILMNALDHAKDQFTDEEYTALKADADKIREIETQIAALPQDEAASQSMAQTASTFPQFEGKDLDGNSVSSSLFADNAFTVVNFWFSGCKPCVDEMDDLNALNQRIQEQGGEVIGINTETLDGNADNIAAAKQILEQAGAAFRNIYFDSASDAGKFALGIMAFPTTCVVDRQGNIVGEPIMGGIDKEDNAATPQKLIDEALAQSQQSWIRKYPLAAASLYFAAPPCGGRCPLLQGLLPGLLSLYSIYFVFSIVYQHFILDKVKRMDYTLLCKEMLHSPCIKRPYPTTSPCCTAALRISQATSCRKSD